MQKTIKTAVEYGIIRRGKFTHFILLHPHRDERENNFMRLFPTDLLRLIASPYFVNITWGDFPTRYEIVKDGNKVTVTQLHAKFYGADRQKYIEYL